MTATHPISSTFGFYGSLLSDSSSSSRKKKNAGLLEDQSGAVMMTGLFMSCFLIGALWFVVGIGDTVVFRDKMQEAADHGAFTSAALHAKGMNFISLCNLVMIVGTVIHIVLGVISDIKYAIMVACIAAFPCWPNVPSRVADFNSAYNMWDNYFKIMSKAFKAIHVVQKAATIAYPAMGAVEAYQVGTKYGGDSRTSAVTVLAVSKSLKGLPLENKPFGFLCKKVVSVATTGLVNLIGVGKSVSGSNPSGKALQVFNDLVGTVLEARYCNDFNMHVQWPVPFGPGFDSFWGEDGPYIMDKNAANGKQAMQTYAVNLNPKLHDTSESHVGIAAKQYSKYTKDVGFAGYFAQSEFYFDCDSQWNTAACNFEDNAMFAIKWRARLHRVDLGGAAQGLTNGVQAIQNAVAQVNQIADRVTSVLGGAGMNNTGLQNVIDGALQPVTNAATSVGAVSNYH